MSSNSPIWVSDLNEEAERENRVRQGLLRGVVENLRSNRVVVPLFGLAICGMFPQWVGIDRLAAWFCQIMLGLLPQMIGLERFPQTAMTVEETQIWTRRVAASNLFFVANWASMGLWLWAAGD